MESENPSNLDDFFAKKDKSKKKSKGKITTDEIEERLERKLKKGKAGGRSDKDRRDGTGTTGVLNVKVGEDDGEWKDVEEETTKDYTGLRIQNFQLSQREQEEKERLEREGENGEEGEDSENRGLTQGPWKQTQAKATPTPPIIPEPAQQETTDLSKDTSKDTGTKTGRYIPPGARQALKSGTTPLSYSSASGPGGQRRKKTAPNVDSQEDFPSLATAASNDPSDQTEFERVRGGGRSMEDPSSQISKLSLGNKYGALDSSSTNS